MTNDMKDDGQAKANGWALVPFLVFAVFYVGLSTAVGDFYKVPMTIAFLVASATAMLYGGRRTLGERIETYARGMGEGNIMIMCLIFILAGAFATVAKGSGAVDAAVRIAQAVVPARFMLAGVFVISCVISLAIGTSCGTIAAVTPIALGFAPSLGISPMLLVGATIGGAMFGDNLSMISDTTIAATRTQGIEMREKFFANFRIALPAALVALGLYAAVGCANAAGTSPAEAVTWREGLLVLPYVLILALALAGFNVMMLLTAGALMSVAVGILLSRITFWSGLELLGQGTLGMSETLIVAILAGGLFSVIRSNGGIRWLTERISLLVRGPRTCELGVLLLVSAVNLFTANNTVAIVIAGPIARECSKRFGAAPSRIASVLDTASCIVQGVIPYGAQILIALGVARTMQADVGSLGLLKCLYYQPLLLVALLVSMAFARRPR